MSDNLLNLSRLDAATYAKIMDLVKDSYNTGGGMGGLAMQKAPRIDHQLLGYLCAQVGLNKNDGTRIDAGETMFLARQLEFISAKVYETQYPALLARRFIPVNSEVPTGAQTWTYRMWDKFGMAAIIHSYADDLPRVGRLAKEYNLPIRSIGASYGYSLQDLRAALFAGVPLAADLAMVARTTIDTKMDQLAALGDADNGILGFLNNTNIPTSSITGSWASAQPLAILADLNLMQSDIVNNTKQIILPDTILFDQVSWQIVNNTPMSAVNTTSILQTFLKNSPYIRNADVWWRLDTAYNGGPQLMMYARRPDVIEMIIPQEFEQLPPQMENLGFNIPCHSRFGGVSTKYPLGATKAHGM